MGKRITIATFFGLICGFICMMMASSGGALPLAIKLQILASRTIMGFAIGISALKLNWWFHGILMGLIFSLPLGFSSMLAPGEFSPAMLLIMTVVMGIIYGFIIELFTTVVFKAKAT